MIPPFAGCAPCGNISFSLEESLPASIQLFPSLSRSLDVLVIYAFPPCSCASRSGHPHVSLCPSQPCLHFLIQHRVLRSNVPLLGYAPSCTVSLPSAKLLKPLPLTFVPEESNCRKYPDRAFCPDVTPAVFPRVRFRDDTASLRKEKSGRSAGIHAATMETLSWTKPHDWTPWVLPNSSVSTQTGRAQDFHNRGLIWKRHTTAHQDLLATQPA